MRILKIINHFALLTIAITLTSCSGGGGGDGGGGVVGRTTDTALRIIHGALDASPVTLKIGEETLQSARFAELKNYVRTSDGATAIVVERANDPGVTVSTFGVTLKDKTEYTVFLYGEVSRGSFATRLLEDIVSRPEAGLANFQVLNAFQDGGEIVVTIAGKPLDSVAFGGTSGFIEVPSGPQTVTVSGGASATLALDIPDRGEITLLVTGDRALGVLFTPVYTDLD